MMKCCLFFIILLASGVAFGAGSTRLQAPVIIGGTDAILSYDDGSAMWLTWDGLYRGVWFDVTDFNPTATLFFTEYTEYWFYHSVTSHPWDTASFYAELWNGDANGPVEQLDQTSMVATHYAPVHADYSPIIVTEAEFWGLVNTSMSSGGWPALIGDGSRIYSPHSFYSDDFTIWVPWVVAGTTNDYFIRAGGEFLALESESWGAIKGMFR